MSAVYKIALGLIAGLASLVLLLSRYGSLRLGDSLVIFFIAAIVLVRVVEPPTAHLMKQRAARRDRRLASMVEQATKALWLDLMRAGIDMMNPSITCFRVERGLMRLRQVPYVQFGLRHRPDLRVRWSIGQGLQGLAWVRQETVTLEADRTGRRFAGEHSASLDWTPSKGDMEHQLGSANLAIATPVLVENQYWGCVSVEFRHRWDGSPSDITDMVAVAAHTVANLAEASGARPPRIRLAAVRVRLRRAVWRARSVTHSGLAATRSFVSKLGRRRV